MVTLSFTLDRLFEKTDKIEETVFLKGVCKGREQVRIRRKLESNPIVECNKIRNRGETPPECQRGDSDFRGFEEQ